jgi:hypothetical protein
LIKASELEQLEDFIIRAKAATYAGNGEFTRSCRTGSHDLQFADGEWSYLDSYFGGRDFIGEEVVFFRVKPVWAMNYYGSILIAQLITPDQAGKVIKASLSSLYKEKRFLGGFKHEEGDLIYLDANAGDLTHFTGTEKIICDDQVAYELVYHGGMIKDD